MGLQLKVCGTLGASQPVPSSFNIIAFESSHFQHLSCLLEYFKDRNFETEFFFNLSRVDSQY